MMRETILMFPFSEVVKCNRGYRKKGKIVCGMHKISSGFYEHLIRVFDNVPEKTEWQKASGIVLDGVFQMIRMYENDSIIKEFA